MKNCRLITRQLTIFLFAFGIVSNSFAEKMDQQTQDQLVERLQNVLEKINPQDAAWAATQLRLADVVAERARSRFMAEVESNCQNCKGSSNDRDLAISIYQKVLKNFENKKGFNEESFVLFQLAHLFQIKSQDTQSLFYFQKILDGKNKNFDSKKIAKAHEGIAEILFRQKKYQTALDHYQAALVSKEISNRGNLQYKSAWCLFNLGKLEKATQSLESLLKNKESLSRQGTDGDQYDSVFHADAVGDLAVFYARGNVSSFELNKFTQFIPVGREKDLLLAFSKEVNRLGKKEAALMILGSYLKLELNESERLDASLMAAQINYAMGREGAAISDFKKVAQSLLKNPCTEESRCREIRVGMKNFVTELHKMKKAILTKDLARAYQIYCEVYKDDSTMSLIGGQVAREVGQFSLAMTMLHQAASTAAEAVVSEQDKAIKVKSVETLNKALEAVLDIAEQSQNLDLRESAYLFYLKLKPDDAKAYSIKYQLAHLSYEKKQYSKAADAFKVLVLQKTFEQNLKKQAADLALDSLVIQNRDADIEQWALEFANEIPTHRLEFVKISRKATINIVSRVINDRKSSQVALKDALKKMQNLKFEGATLAEKISCYRNEFSLSRRIPDLNSALVAVKKILVTPGLSKKEQEEALGQQVWIAEMRFEFKMAYQTALKMSFSNLNESERQLKLGNLAELADVTPTVHYRKFLKLHAEGSQSEAIRARLVEISADPVAELKIHHQFFQHRPEVLGELLLVIYNRMGAKKMPESYLKDSRVAKSQAGKLLQNLSDLEALAKINKSISQAKLHIASDYLLQASIKQRLQFLMMVEKVLKKSNTNAILQIASLSIMARENKRFHEDLISLPVPKKLNEQERAFYNRELLNRARPYGEKAKIAEEKYHEILESSAIISKLVRSLKMSNPRFRPLLTAQIKEVAKYLPENSLGEVDSVLSLNREIPTQQELIGERENLKAQPFSTSEIEKLKNMETKIGNEVMVSYLDGRIKSLRTQEGL